MAMMKVAAVLFASLFLAACGQSSALEPRDRVAAGDAPPATSTAVEDGAGDCGIAYESRPHGSEQVPDATPYVGKTLADARAYAAAAGHELRVVGEDGECFMRIQNLTRKRVNVYVADGEVEAAGHF